MEMCEIWSHHETKAKTYKKAIEQSNKIKQKEAHPQLKELKIVVENCKRYCYPFVCYFCKIFFSGQKSIFWNWKSKVNENEMYCADCLSYYINVEEYKSQVLKFIFQ